ncbi:GNAT family N-acetyltransferase [Brevibacterium luteolum]|uniref:GNAT family N-acetyltransferase n=1 Tax=Brevibacterium luteolum TaxID=199591 RepID=UPI003B67137A
MADTTPIDPDALSISPFDEVDALDLREFLMNAQEQFWGDLELKDDHDPYWFRQFASSGLVAKHKTEIVGYLLGAIPIDGPAYIHLVAARSDFRHQGIGRHLYDAFIDLARSKGVQEVQATTMPDNSGAISFHSSMGFESELMEDYGGPGVARVFFRMPLTSY